MAQSLESQQYLQMMNLPLQTLLVQASQRLAAAGIETPVNDARILLSEACETNLHKLDKAILMRQTLGDFVAQRKVKSESSIELRLAGQLVAATFEGYIRRRIQREPLQYIVGHATFRFLDLLVGPGVFIPRPETETVVQAGLEWLKEQEIESPLIVDLCAGSGAVGLAMSTEVPRAQVWAVEISKEAFAWTQRNYERCQPDIDIQKSHYHLVLGDAASPNTLADLNGQVDLVISNPPYLPEARMPTQPEVVLWDPPQALYGASTDGTNIPRHIIFRAFALLHPGGCLILEHDISQSDVLREFAQSVGFNKVTTHTDMTGRERYLSAVR